MRTGDLAGPINMLGTQKTYVFRRLFTKHPYWAYEQEFRLAGINISGEFSIPSTGIKEVHFGLQTDYGVKKMLRDALKGKDIGLYQMEKVEPYGMIRTPL